MFIVVPQLLISKLQAGCKLPDKGGCTDLNFFSPLSQFMLDANDNTVRYIHLIAINLMNSFSQRFDIRLMRTGRMKGQAFIGLPNEEVASRAVQETNGFVLHGKPMVVVSKSAHISTSFLL